MNTIQNAEDFVFALFKDKLSPLYSYHNFYHTSRVVNAVEKLITTENLSKNEETALLLAAWFHDTGYVDGLEKHEEKSIHYLNDFIKSQPVDSAILPLAESLIRATEFCKEPQTLTESIIRDADCSHFADKNYLSISELLRDEWEVTLNRKLTDLEWLIENRDLLTRRHRYFTNHGKKKWQKQKEDNIALLQERIHLLQSDQEKAASKKKKNEKEEKPERGIETMFRVTLNNHTQLSQIADSKANILLSVNAIIISVALSTLIPKLDSPSNAHLVMPTFILIFFSVVSIIFAILSTKPKVTSGKFTRKQIADKNVNLLFFGNFYKMPAEEYLWAMNEMMKDKEYLYNSMVKDLYFLGLVLHRKYSLLRTTYTVFMIGILASVFSFVYAFYNLRG